MSYDELLNQQTNLHNEAQEVLSKSGLLEIISKYGEVDIGGSFKTGLMVWRDIDIGVYALPSEDELWKIAREIYTIKNISSLTIMNNFRKGNVNYPKGWYFGIKIKEKENTWKIDLWFAKEKADLEFENWLIENLNDENKKYILEIKSFVWENPKYKKTIFSIDIYKAVIEDSVKDIKGFEKFLKNSGRSLS